VPVSGGYGELQNENSGKDIVVQSASTAQGAEIIQYTQNGSSNGLWLPIRESDGHLAVQEPEQRPVPGPGRRRHHPGRPVRPVGLQLRHRRQPGLRHPVTAPHRGAVKGRAYRTDDVPWV
jgi:hypothetical protein